MNREKIFNAITKQLFQQQDLVYRDGSSAFFKEEINPIGVRSAQVRQIAKSNFKKFFPQSDKKEVFVACQELLVGEYDEQKTVALIWLSFLAQQGQLEEQDFELLEKILLRHVSNWAHCDELCTHTIGVLVFQFPSLVAKVKEWTKSENRWIKRAAAVSLIYPVRREKKFLKEIFFVAKQLINDQDDLVQKGYGWALKEGSNFYTKEVFDFVVRNKKIMPRVALRYAIEKMPVSMKKLAMEK